MSSEHKDVEVHVQSLKTNDRAHFKVPDSTTIDAVWAIAVSPSHLDEPRSAGDTIRCKGGADLTARLGATLAALAEDGECREHQFEIRGPSGGACSA